MYIDNGFDRRADMQKSVDAKEDSIKSGEFLQAFSAELNSKQENIGGNGNQFENVNMPIQEKQAMEKTLSGMSEDGASLSLMSVLAPSSINATKENEFLDYNEIMNRIDNILNPPLGGEPTAEQKESLTKFRDEFEKNYNMLSEQSEQINSIKDREVQLSKARILG